MKRNKIISKDVIILKISRLMKLLASFLEICRKKISAKIDKLATEILATACRA